MPQSFTTKNTVIRKIDIMTKADHTKVFAEAPAKEPDRQMYFIEKSRDLLAETEQKAGRKITYDVVTFGCQMNARDSEKLAGILDKMGFEQSDSEDADYVIYNTCTVRENANNKVYGRLGGLGNAKKKNPFKRIALCGCMMQEEHVVQKLRESYRFVDLVFGTHNIFKFAELTYRILAGEEDMIIDIWESTDTIVEELPINRKFAFKSGVNIMFGCDNFCTYCIVPYVRGRERSRKPEDILHEIEVMAKDGVKEVMLLGQNVNSYGKGLEEKISFAGLLREVEKIDGIERIRFMTSHPKDLSDELIDVMASSEKICRHMHLPLQSGSDEILKRMNRHYDKARYLELVAKLREKMPDIAITTDIIVGFPGETEEDFAETVDVVEKARFDSAFTFIYSKRTGTPAAKMDPGADEATVKKRFDKLLKVVQRIAAEQAATHTGETVSVLAEQRNEQDESLITGRMSNNSTVHFKGDVSAIGSIVNVHLDECKGFYYYGTQV